MISYEKILFSLIFVLLILAALLFIYGLIEYLTTPVYNYTLNETYELWGF